MHRIGFNVRIFPNDSTVSIKIIIKLINIQLKILKRNEGIFLDKLIKKIIKIKENYSKRY